MAEKNATLTLPTGEVIDLPVLKGSYGPDVVDVSGLLKAGYFTYDPGFMSTAATESKITFIDGDQGCYYTVDIQSKNWQNNPIF